jgi:hypothetical protein
MPSRFFYMPSFTPQGRVAGDSDPYVRPGSLYGVGVAVLSGPCRTSSLCNLPRPTP